MPMSSPDTSTPNAEEIAWTLISGLWAVALLGGTGYLLGGLSAALLGGAAGLCVAAYFYRNGMPEPVRRTLGIHTSPRRDETIDWTQLLDYEKFYFARELEQEGRDQVAEEVYQHLINQDFPSIEPFRRLADIYRQRGDYQSEIDILDRAIARLDDQEKPGSISSKRTREELVRQRKKARERHSGSNP